MDYQCIVVYTIVRMRPYNSPAHSSLSCSLDNSNTNDKLNVGNNKTSNTCLEWIKLQIKR